MKRKKIVNLSLILSAVCIMGNSTYAQQWITSGAAGSRYTQPDNSFPNNNDWIRSIGVGYFTPNGIVPESFLHVNTQYSLLPQNGSITGVGETFRTTVGGGVAQRWRMERDANEIGRIWHQTGHRSFHVMAPEPRDDGLDRYSGVIVQNNVEDGLWVMNDDLPTGGRAFPNAAQLLDAKGFAALGHLSDATGPGAGNPRGPWSRLHFFHAENGTTPWFAHRPQMRNGITLTGNSDHSYIGQWYDQGTGGIGAEVDDHSNLVIASSDDALPAGLGHHWDHISFRFMGDMAASQGAASGVEGLEMMRIRPFRATTNDPIEGFVGIGDFLAASTGPEERLDLLDGTIRLRAFSGGTTYQTSTADRVMVADAADGRVYWRPMTDLAGQTDCDWTVQNAGVSGAGVPHTLYTATGLSNSCPDASDKVGIGTISPVAKLQVYNLAGSGEDVAIYSSTFVDQGNPGYGLKATASRSGSDRGPFHHGVRGEASDAEIANYGVSARSYNNAGYGNGFNYAFYGEANGSNQCYGIRNYVTGDVMNYGSYNYVTSSLSATNYGEYTVAFGNASSVTNYGGRFAALSNSSGSVNYGIYASAGSVGTNYAGYFVGNGVHTGSWTQISDALLKTNVQDLGNCLSTIAQLSPRSYDFLSADYPGMSLPTTPQVGVIAQELEQVIPDLVSDIVHPAQIDTAGNVLAPEMTFKGVNYIGLIPYLIGAIQEQQAQIQSMQQDLAACCTPSDADLDPRSSLTDPITPLGKNSNRLTIAPNPFQEQTTMSYLLEAPARVQLQVNTANGLHLVTLRDQQQAEGAYSMTWNTQDLAPGVYYVTLFADGVPVVKKAVKVK